MYCFCFHFVSFKFPQWYHMAVARSLINSRYGILYPKNGDTEFFKKPDLNPVVVAFDN